VVLSNGKVSVQAALGTIQVKKINLSGKVSNYVS